MRSAGVILVCREITEKHRINYGIKVSVAGLESMWDQPQPISPLNLNRLPRARSKFSSPFDATA